MHPVAFSLSWEHSLARMLQDSAKYPPTEEFPENSTNRYTFGKSGPHLKESSHNESLN